MKKFDVSRFSKRAAWALKLVNTCYWLSLVLIVLVFVLAVAVLFLPENVFNLSNMHAEGLSVEIVSGLVLNLGDANLAGSINFRPLVIPFIGSIFIGLMCFVKIFWELKNILKQVVQCQPFALENGNRMTAIASVLIGLSFLGPAINELLLFRTIELFQLNNFSANFKIDFFLLITGLLVLLLAEVFKYGAFLQTEYDETL